MLPSTCVLRWRFCADVCSSLSSAPSFQTAVEGADGEPQPDAGHAEQKRERQAELTCPCFVMIPMTGIMLNDSPFRIITGFAQKMFFIPIFRANLVLIPSHGSGSFLGVLPGMDGQGARPAVFFCHFPECPTWPALRGLAVRSWQIGNAQNPHDCCSGQPWNHIGSGAWGRGSRHCHSGDRGAVNHLHYQVQSRHHRHNNHHRPQ